MNHYIATGLLTSAVLMEVALTSLTSPSFKDDPEEGGQPATTQAPTTSRQTGMYIDPPSAVIETPATDQPPLHGLRASSAWANEPGRRTGGRENVTQESFSAAFDHIVPRVTQSGPPPGYEAPRADIANDVDRGVQELDQSVRKIPGYTALMVGEVQKHGIAALAYTNPEMKRAGNQIGREVGSGIGHLVRALGKDMVAGAKGQQ